MIWTVGASWPSSEREGDRCVNPALNAHARFLRAQGLDSAVLPGAGTTGPIPSTWPATVWQGDVMYGPSLPAKDGSRRKTYFLAIIDDATRWSATPSFYYEQHLRSLKDCLKQAFCKRGLPRRLYFDNGQIFRSRMLLPAGRPPRHPPHSQPPYQPQGRAKIERWFLSVRKSFLPRVDLDRLEDLAALNRLLFAWIEGDTMSHPPRAWGEKPPSTSGCGFHKAFDLYPQTSIWISSSWNKPLAGWPRTGL